MINVLLNVIKIAFLLGLLIFVHELGHFLLAKIFKVRVQEFSIGFGPTIWKKQWKETKYQLRAIPLGGFVNLLGEEEESFEEGSFRLLSRWKKIVVLVAGGLSNIIFGLLLYFIIVAIYTNIGYAFYDTMKFLQELAYGIKQLFIGKVGIEEFTGPVGISEIVIQTKTIVNYVYILSVISISLGVTNLLPFPPLDGGKVLLLLIEAIIRKPIKENLNNAIQVGGFIIIMTLAVIVTFKDIIRIF